MSTKCPLAKFLQLIVKILKKKYRKKIHKLFKTNWFINNYSKYKYLLTKDPSETSSL